MEQFHHAFHGVFIPGEGGFHRPVGQILHKTGKGQASGPGKHPVPEPDSLNLAAHPYMNRNITGFSIIDHVVSIDQIPISVKLFFHQLTSKGYVSMLS